MPASSPTRDGFRAVLRRPAVLLAEIAWRWTFAAFALAVVVAVSRAYLRALSISAGDAVELRSGDPQLIADALGHLLEAGTPLFYRLMLVALPAILVAWIIAASIGRSVTLKALLGGKGTPAIRPLVGLHFLRAAVALAAALGYFGSMLLASLLTTPTRNTDPNILLSNIGTFLFIFLFFIVIVLLLWSVLNWFLSIAPIFAVRDGTDGLASVGRAVALFRRRSSEFFAVGAWFALWKIGWAVLITVVALVPVLAVGAFPRATVMFVVALTLLYLAVADFLYLARLAAYVSLSEERSQSLSVGLQSLKPAPGAVPAENVPTTPVPPAARY